MPNSLKTIASEAASDVVKNDNIPLSKTDTKENMENKKKERLDKIINIAQDTITDVIFEGESYCVIAEPLNYKSENLAGDSNVFGIEDSVLEIDDSLNISPQKETNKENSESISSPTEEKSKATGGGKTKLKSAERSCSITCVTILKEEDSEDKFIVAGVKIESRKVRKNKERHKHKLSLLVYKLAGKVKVKGSQSDVNSEIINPLSSNPFLPMMGSVYEDDFSVVSDEDYCLFEDSDPTQLSVIDEYLLAAQKSPSAGNGGTQNIGPNEIKTGFDQEEVVKIDDIKTVYEDCAFHKFDIDRKFYTKEMFVSDLLVVDGYLVTILRKQMEIDLSTDDEEEEKNCLLVSSISMNKKRVIDLKLVGQKIFTGDSLIKDIVLVPCQKLPTNLLTNLTALNQFENMDNNPKHTAGVPQSLVALGLSDNSITFLSVPQLTELKIPSKIHEDRKIHKIAYCTALSSLAICDDKGFLTICSCSSNQENPYEMSLNDLSVTAGKDYFQKFLMLI